MSGYRREESTGHLRRDSSQADRPPAEARRALDDCVGAADREAVHMGERRAVDSLWPFAFRPVLLHVPLRQRELRAANVLSLSRHVPSRAGQTDTRIYEARGAEAPDQRTARGRLL